MNDASIIKNHLPRGADLRLPTLLSPLAGSLPSRQRYPHPTVVIPSTSSSSRHHGLTEYSLSHELNNSGSILFPTCGLRSVGRFKGVGLHSLFFPISLQSLVSFSTKLSFFLFPNLSINFDGEFLLQFIIQPLLDSRFNSIRFCSSFFPYISSFSDFYAALYF